uniref:Stalled ribosome sensor GCN1-like HEAT repeats region domain-containing protein n=1 Tax=Dunaliella tertiolecta TaxID=3047 RepID=A0A7S3R359_DUNTE
MHSHIMSTNSRYVDVRNMACFVIEQLLMLVGPKLNHEARRAIYPELIKRLDDSSNQVRVAACKALAVFCTTMNADYCETNSGYLAAGVVIHMDDSEMSVQEAACSVLEALAARKPHPVRLEIMKVRDRFRSKHYCDRVLAACEKPQT